MSAEVFRYDGYELDRDGRRLVCRYSLGDRRFSEEITVELDGTVTPGDPAPVAAVDAAARIVHLLAGVSYYKTAAPRVVDLGDLATTPGERDFLRTFYLEGLGEFAYRNAIDLSDLEIVGPTAARAPLALHHGKGRPLVPFGAGIDSIVTLESVREAVPSPSLFVVSRGGDRFAAIERAVAATGLPVVRASRSIDPAVLRAGAHGFLNGHVPVTGILSAIAVMAAVLGGHDAVVMANEHSASVPTVEAGGRPVNHQWSKSLAFEAGFRRLLEATFTSPPAYFSFLRARSELWVARRFAALERYHPVFCSCNRVFAIERARRLDSWCGTCDKCCFIDLVLAPFLPASALDAIFGGREPLRDDALAPRFSALLGTGEGAKPFECVGDEEECRTAVLLAADRADRATCPLLQSLAEQVRRAGMPDSTTGTASKSATTPNLSPLELAARAARHFEPRGPDFVAPEYQVPATSRAEP